MRGGREATLLGVDHLLDVGRFLQRRRAFQLFNRPARAFEPLGGIDQRGLDLRCDLQPIGADAQRRAFRRRRSLKVRYRSISMQPAV